MLTIFAGYPIRKLKPWKFNGQKKKNIFFNYQETCAQEIEFLQGIFRYQSVFNRPT